MGRSLVWGTPPLALRVWLRETSRSHAIRLMVVLIPLTLSPVETCFHKDHTNLYGAFILGVNIKYGLSIDSLGSKVAYTSERVHVWVCICFNEPDSPQRIHKKYVMYNCITDKEKSVSHR